MIKFKLSKTFVIFSLVVLVIVVGVSGWFVFSQNSSRRLESDTSKPNETLNSNGNGGGNDKAKDVLPEKTQVQDVGAGVDKSKYPSILTKHKLNPEIGFNLALNSTDSASVYGFDKKNREFKKLYNYLQLPYQATNQNVIIANNFILQRFQLDENSNQTFTQISWAYFNNETKMSRNDYIGELPLAFTNGKYGEAGKSIPENVIWFGFGNSKDKDYGSETLPTKERDYSSKEFANKGVYIYTRSLKNDVGTYLKDLNNDVEFKISNEYCGWITFSKTDFWCLNDKKQLVNLTTNQNYNEAEETEFNEIIEMPDGSLLAVKNGTSVIRLEFDSNGGIQSLPDIFKAIEGENITNLSLTNQDELLIQLSRSQSQDFKQGDGSKEGSKSVLNNLYTVELKDGNTIARPEFDQFTVIF